MNNTAEYEKIREEMATYLTESQIPQRVRLLLDELSTCLVEREEICALILIAIFSRHHVFLLGKPGCGKSYLINYMTQVVRGVKVFEKQFSKEMEEKDVLGDGGKKIPMEETIGGAFFAFLDEMFKGADTVLSSLLSVLNERVMFIDGEAVKIPLSTAFTASNEVSESTFMEAFIDRLLLWYEVPTIENLEEKKKYYMKQTKTGKTKIENTFTEEEVFAISNLSDKMIMSDFFAGLLAKITECIKRDGIYCSDRKFGPNTIIRALGVSALLNGRTAIDFSDFVLIKHFSWKNYVERKKLNTVLADAIYGNKNAIRKSIMDIETPLRSVVGNVRNIETFLTHCDEVRTESEFRERYNKAEEYLKTIQKYRDSFQELLDMQEKASLIDKQCDENIFIAQRLLNPFKGKEVSESMINIDSLFDNSILTLKTFFDSTDSFYRYEEIRYAKLYE